MKRLIFLLLLLLPGLTTFAQDATTTESTPGFWDDPFNHPLLPLYAVTALVFITVILVMVVAIYMLKVLNIMTRQATEERAAKTGIAYAPQPSWWQKFWMSINASVPVDKEKTVELDHNYDGIRELDNHLPPWWKWLFYATIAWAVVYLVVYHVSLSLPLSEQEYENQVAEAEASKKKFAASQPASVIDENTLVFIEDAEIITKGKQVFTANNCQSCHRNDGGGNNIGPNLTDNYWIHGGSIKEIFTTVKNGAVEKGMPAWGKVMSPQDVRNVTFFVMSLQGTNPPEAKAPQGDLFRPEPPASKPDSAKVTASLN